MRRAFRIVCWLWNAAAIGAAATGGAITVALILEYRHDQTFLTALGIPIYPRLVPALVAVICFVPATTWYWGRMRWGQALAVLLPLAATYGIVVLAFVSADSRQARIDLFDAELGIAIGTFLVLPIAIARRGWPDLIRQWRTVRVLRLRARRNLRSRGTRRFFAAAVCGLSLVLVIAIWIEAQLLWMAAQHAVKAVSP